LGDALRLPVVGGGSNVERAVSAGVASRRQVPTTGLSRFQPQIDNMSRHEVPLDELGFPIPQGFEDQSPRRRWRPQRKQRGARGGPGRRLIAGLLVAAVIVAICWPQIQQHVPPLLADWFKKRAAERFYGHDDADGAISDLNRAVALAPQDVEAYLLRGEIRIYAGADEQGFSDALADFEEALKIEPNNVPAIRYRSVALQQLGRHQEAIAEASRVVKFSDSGPDRHSALNFRAYTRARAKMELDEALDDVNKAIDLAGAPNAAYLDTRGFILHLLGKNDEALIDMKLAVKMAERQRRLEQRAMADLPFQDGRRSFLQRQYDQEMAVLYYHRGLVHQALGNKQDANKDKRQGVRLGYDPERGVW